MDNLTSIRRDRMAKYRLTQKYIVFVRDKCCSSYCRRSCYERAPVARSEVGLTNRKWQSFVIDDKWFEKFGQGTRYVDLMNNDDVSGRKRKPEEIESQDSYVDSQESENRSRASQSFGKLKMGDPDFILCHRFRQRGTWKMSTVHEDWVLYPQKKAGVHKDNTTRLALYRKHKKGIMRLESTPCLNKSTGLVFKELWSRKLEVFESTLC
jgi:hypothetical protein